MGRGHQPGALLDGAGRQRSLRGYTHGAREPSATSLSARARGQARGPGGGPALEARAGPARGRGAAPGAHSHRDRTCGAVHGTRHTVRCTLHSTHRAPDARGASRAATRSVSHREPAGRADLERRGPGPPGARAAREGGPDAGPCDGGRADRARPRNGARGERRIIVKMYNDHCVACGPGDPRFSLHA